MVIDKNYVDNFRRNEENTREIIRLKINDDIFHSYRVTVASGLMIILTFSTSLTLLAAIENFQILLISIKMVPPNFS